MRKEPDITITYDEALDCFTVRIEYTRNNEDYVKIITCLTHDEENALESK